MIAALSCLLQPARSFVISSTATYHHGFRTQEPLRCTAAAATAQAKISFSKTRRICGRQTASYAGSANRRMASSVLKASSLSVQSSLSGEATLEQSRTAQTDATTTTAVEIRKPVRSLAEAKHELLNLVSRGPVVDEAAASSGQERVGYLLEVLEGNYTPIQTTGFFNLAVQVSYVPGHGTWTNTHPQSQ